MKKRSMLAIASLATGFVVAAITPSHGVDTDVVGDTSVSDTVDTVGHLVSHDSLDFEDGALGQE
ncbi:hypothetical protein [Streptomyces sp. NPDC086787]|uniref:hypothetical protein n=1 Tax=Streptomyces sp. NPDC086787 TaxID=3365759 RepID=UPI003807BB68